MCSLYCCTAPVAINWVVAKGDIYAAQMMIDAGYLYTCPIYSTRGTFMWLLQKDDAIIKTIHVIRT